MKFAPSKLFHAVVITGAALTGCVGGAQKPKPNEPTKATEQADTGKCPPGSERPTPPCYWIL